MMIRETTEESIEEIISPTPSEKERTFVAKVKEQYFGEENDSNNSS